MCLYVHQVTTNMHLRWHCVFNERSLAKVKMSPVLLNTKLKGPVLEKQLSQKDFFQFCCSHWHDRCIERIAEQARSKYTIAGKDYFKKVFGFFVYIDICRHSYIYICIWVFFICERMSLWVFHDCFSVICFFVMLQLVYGCSKFCRFSKKWTVLASVFKGTIAIILSAILENELFLL